MKFLICFYFLIIGSLTALPVNHNELDNSESIAPVDQFAMDAQINLHSQHPYHSGLIKDYNRNQKFEYKFTEPQLQISSNIAQLSPNERQSLPLVNGRSLDDDLNTKQSGNQQVDNYENNLNKKHSSDKKSSKLNSRSKHSSDESHILSNFEILLNQKSIHQSDTPSAVLSELSTRVNKRYMNSSTKRKDKLRSSIRLKERTIYDHHDQHEICPESSFQNVDLDPVSKAYLAPILFNGKLASLSEDYAGRVAATFQVLKVIKTSTVDFKDQYGQIHKVPIQLEKGHQVVLHFVRKPGQRFIPPHCSVFMNSSSIGSLRLEKKYFVYAAPPTQSLQEMHRHSFGSVTYKAEVNEIMMANDSNSLSNSLSSNLNDNLNSNLSFVINESLNNSSNSSSDNTSDSSINSLDQPMKTVKMQNLVWMNEQHFQIPSKNDQNSTKQINPIPMQFIIHYLSAFYAPEPFAKNISKSISKNLCKKCGKF